MLVLDVWWHRLTALCGAMIASIDILALTGGVGKHSAAVRSGLADRLAWRGVVSTVPVLVIEAREDLQIAAETIALLGCLCLGRSPAEAPMCPSVADVAWGGSTR